MYRSPLGVYMLCIIQAAFTVSPVCFNFGDNFFMCPTIIEPNGNNEINLMMVILITRPIKNKARTRVLVWLNHVTV